MTINRRHIRLAVHSSALALLLHVAPVSAEEEHDRNRPVEIVFTKWVTGVVPATVFLGIAEGRALMTGFTAGAVPGGTFVGEVLQRQQSVNTALKAGIIKLEAIYEVHDQAGNHLLTALIRGGTNQLTGAALLDGVVLAGWRTGAEVHVRFQTIPGTPGTVGCVGAPAGVNCFVGTIRVGRAPRRDDDD
jgi:hypothetical protein